jgi:hypothetical protein
MPGNSRSNSWAPRLHRARKCGPCGTPRWSAASVNLSRSPPSPSRRSRRAPSLRRYSSMWCRPRGGRPASGCLGVGRQDYPRTAGSRFAGRPYKNSSEIRPKRDGTHRSFVPHDRAGAANHGCSQGKSGQPAPPRRPEARPPRSFWSAPYRDHPVPPPPDPAARRLVPRVPRRRVAPLTTE